MKKLLAFSFFILHFSFFIPCAAQYKVLHNFNKTNGAYPYDDLIISGTTLYGMTNGGGMFNHGTIFAIQTDGSLFNVLLNFNDTNGAAPYGHLAITGDTLFGMTYLGGKYGNGVIFSMLTNGSGYTILRNLGGGSNDPINPIGKLNIIGNTLYGMSSAGGTHLLGNIFSINKNGTNYTDLYDFNSPGGVEPQANLTVVGNMMYGTAFLGGPDDNGILFSFNLTSKTFKTIFNFGGTRGENPQGSLLLSGSTLYGMTTFGGNNPDSSGNIFAISDSGTNFTGLADFNRSNGAFPYGSLLLSGGSLIGMTSGGGADSAGVIFEVDTLGGGYTTLFNFKNTQGTFPHGTLLNSNGTFYGMAYTGGTLGYGVVFSFKDSTVGVKDIKTNSELVKVYPNPGKGIFSIEMKNEKLKVKNIEVFNILGEKVYSNYQITNSAALMSSLNNGQATNKSSNYQIDLSSNPNGIYFYYVIGADGSFLCEGKLIILK